jgi:hypothetical protein
LRMAILLLNSPLLWQPQRQEQPAAGYSAIHLVRGQARMRVAPKISLIA